jgi:hypothetical protein
MRNSTAVAGGSEDGRQNSLLRALQTRFGPIPGDLATAIEAVVDVGELERLWEIALTANSLTAIRAAIQR